MSLVQLFWYKDFILVGGEQRLTKTDGTYYENFIKVRKLNNVAIIGMTGDVGLNLSLFRDFIDEYNNLKSDYLDESYVGIENIIKNRFEQNDFNIRNGIHSFVCGWDGFQFRNRIFFTNNKTNNGSFVINFDKSDKPNILSCGDTSIHYNNANKLMQNYPNTILGMKNTFKDVIDLGVKFDNSINKNLTFEYIRRSDMEKWERN